MKYDGVSNSAISECIDEWIRGERDRKIIKRRIIDGIKLEALAEEFEMSVCQIRRIISCCEIVINAHIIATK